MIIDTKQLRKEILEYEKEFRKSVLLIKDAERKQRFLDYLKSSSQRGLALIADIEYLASLKGMEKISRMKEDE